MLVSLEVPSGCVHAARRVLGLGLAHLFWRFFRSVVRGHLRRLERRPGSRSLGLRAELRLGGDTWRAAVLGGEARGLARWLRAVLGGAASCSVTGPTPPERRPSSWADGHRRTGGPPPRLWTWLPFLSVVLPNEGSRTRGVAALHGGRLRWWVSASRSRWPSRRCHLDSMAATWKSRPEGTRYWRSRITCRWRQTRPAVGSPVAGSLRASLRPCSSTPGRYPDGSLRESAVGFAGGTRGPSCGVSSGNGPCRWSERVPCDVSSACGVRVRCSFERPPLLNRGTPPSERVLCDVGVARGACAG